MATFVAIVIFVACICAALTNEVLALPRNLTIILSHYPEFSNFNTLLTETSVAEEIDNMRTATLFVPDNSKVLRDMIFQLRVDPAMRDLLTDLCKFHATTKFLDLERNSTTRIPTLLPGRSFLIRVDTKGDMSILNSNRSSASKPAIIQGNIQSPGTLGVYSIDRVLNPAYAVHDDEHSSSRNNTSPETMPPGNSSEATTNSTSSSSTSLTTAAFGLHALVCLMLVAGI